MAPMVALAAAQAAMGLIKGGVGFFQNAQAKKKLNALKRPVMNIPQEAVNALNNAQKQSLMTTLPGQDLMEQKIGSNVQANVNALQDVSSGGSLLGATNAAFNQGQNQMTDLDIAAAQFQQANQQGYRNELNNMAGRRDQQFKVNELDPYNQKYAELSNQRDAGAQNMWGGLGMAANAAGSYLGMQQQQSQLNTLMGLDKTMGQNGATGIPQLAMKSASPTQAMGLQPMQKYAQPVTTGDLYQSAVMGYLQPKTPFNMFPRNNYVTR